MDIFISFFYLQKQILHILFLFFKHFDRKNFYLEENFSRYIYFLNISINLYVLYKFHMLIFIYFLFFRYAISVSS